MKKYIIKALRPVVGPVFFCLLITPATIDSAAATPPPKAVSIKAVKRAARPAPKRRAPVKKQVTRRPKPSKASRPARKPATSRISRSRNSRKPIARTAPTKTPPASYQLPLTQAQPAPIAAPIIATSAPIKPQEQIAAAPELVRPVQSAPEPASPAQHSVQVSPPPLPQAAIIPQAPAIPVAPPPPAQSIPQAPVIPTAPPAPSASAPLVLGQPNKRPREEIDAVAIARNSLLGQISAGHALRKTTTALPAKQSAADLEKEKREKLRRQIAGSDEPEDEDADQEFEEKPKQNIPVAPRLPTAIPAAPGIPVAPPPPAPSIHQAPKSPPPPIKKAVPAPKENAPRGDLFSAIKSRPTLKPTGNLQDNQIGEEKPKAKPFTGGILGELQRGKTLKPGVKRELKEAPAVPKSPLELAREKIRAAVKPPLIKPTKKSGPDYKNEDWN